MRRFFRFLNRFLMVPMFRLGLGALIVNPVSGYIMVLKTVGRKTGKARRTPLNYAIVDGCAYCVAGWGTIAHWYRNLQATPNVEILLPGGSVSGIAESVDEAAE
jgi:deazaflavin-dependent oxidoreductase (nitroreductase family)